MAEVKTEEIIVNKAKICEETDRKRFLSWARSQGFHTSETIHRDYEQSKVNWMWKAWKAASSYKPERVLVPSILPPVNGKVLEGGIKWLDKQ